MYKGKMISLGTPAVLKEALGKSSMEEVFVESIEREEAASL
jgi:hypothetical protein